jgi:hypothetical protein
MAKAVEPIRKKKPPRRSRKRVPFLRSQFIS